METKTGTLLVPGAGLFYKIRGEGPSLLILQGGAGDADASDGIASGLIDRYTVITYDRRGISRSTLDGPQETWSLETHSEDASRLLAACAAEPALVVGFSIGAIIGLDLAIRHPLQVKTLIAHEPPLVHVLPEPLRTQGRREQDEAVEAYRREGAPAAGKKFMVMTGVNYEDREPGVERPQPNPRAVANSEFFLAHDAPAAHAYRLDVAALKASSARVVLAAGRATAGLWIHECPRSLARLLDANAIEFPGGHAGFASHPQAFAARLREVLAGAAAA